MTTSNDVPANASAIAHGWCTTILLLFCMVISPAIHAQAIHTCIDGHGAIAYQNAPCPAGQRTRAVREYRNDPLDSAAAERLKAIEQEMDRRNRDRPRVARGAGARTRTRPVVDPCRAAKEKRASTLKRVGLKRDFDLLSRLDSEVWDVCKGF